MNESDQYIKQMIESWKQLHPITPCILLNKINYHNILEWIEIEIPKIKDVQSSTNLSSLVMESITSNNVESISYYLLLCPYQLQELVGYAICYDDANKLATSWKQYTNKFVIKWMKIVKQKQNR